MNDTTEDTQTDSNKLQGAFGDRGTNFNALNFSHPYAEGIIERAKELLNESEAGQALIRVQTNKKVPIHVLKGDGESGYNHLSKVIYVPISGKKHGLDAKAFLLFVKAIRSLDQEFIGLETPDPTMDVMHFAARLHSKNIDSIIYACKVVKEMSNSKVFSNLLDALDSFGYSELYKAYDSGLSREELYDIYAKG